MDCIRYLQFWVREVALLSAVVCKELCRSVPWPWHVCTVRLISRTENTQIVVTIYGSLLDPRHERCCHSPFFSSDYEGEQGHRPLPPILHLNLVEPLFTYYPSLNNHFKASMTTANCFTVTVSFAFSVLAIIKTKVLPLARNGGNPIETPKVRSPARPTLKAPPIRASRQHHRSETQHANHGALEEPWD